VKLSAEILVSLNYSVWQKTNWENLMGLMKNYTWFWWNGPPLVD
jgi:hypothetical protein